MKKMLIIPLLGVLFGGLSFAQPTPDTMTPNPVEEMQTELLPETESVVMSGEDVNQIPVVHHLSQCSINGEAIPCELLLEQAKTTFEELGINLSSVLKSMLIIGGLALVLGLVCFVFWLWMLIDAIKYQKENQMVWILVMVFFNALGALIYYFAAKKDRKLNPDASVTPSQDTTDLQE